MLKNAEIPTSAEVLGRTLREIRLSRKWSLKEFEIASGGRIKDVVLGSYERGSRSISVSKLETIAETYAIPMSAFFTNKQEFKSTEIHGRVVIDLRKLREVLKAQNSDATMLVDQFVKAIINLRKDWNGEILSLRSSDLVLLSMLTSSACEDLEIYFLSKD
jgi:transcriptional regulator with XRE-family HTH domain